MSLSGRASWILPKNRPPSPINYKNAKKTCILVFPVFSSILYASIIFGWSLKATAHNFSCWTIALLTAVGVWFPAYCNEINYNNNNNNNI